jgi:hypothetical protein
MIWENLFWFVVALGFGNYFASLLNNAIAKLDTRLEMMQVTSDLLHRGLWKQDDSKEKENRRKLDSLSETVMRFDMNLTKLAIEVRRLKEPPAQVKAQNVSEAAIRELTGGNG